MEQGYDMEGMDIHFYSFSKGPVAVGVSFGDGSYKFYILKDNQIMETT